MLILLCASEPPRYLPARRESGEVLCGSGALIGTEETCLSGCLVGETVGGILEAA